METVIGAFENLIDGWANLWTGLPSFWSLFSYWLPSDIVSTIAVLFAILIALACWRIFH